MADSSMFGMNLMAIGGQMAQAWQSMIEAWWSGLLGDRDRLRELAKKLSAVSEESPRPTEELSRLVELLELLEKRQRGLEEKVEALAENLAAVVSFLERSQGQGEGEGGE